MKSDGYIDKMRLTDLEYYHYDQIWWADEIKQRSKITKSCVEEIEHCQRCRKGERDGE